MTSKPEDSTKLTRGYRDFQAAASMHYPDELRAGGPLDQGMFEAFQDVMSASYQDRFVTPFDRTWVSSIYQWSFPIERNKARGALALTYKGLINIKTPFDLVLYTRLIWELQPRTIIEFGSYQGGSALWLADQMQVLCNEAGVVHSFDLRIECVSSLAMHPSLQFHKVDLNAPELLDRRLLDSLPHPWLVIDDAHVNVFGVFEHLDTYMAVGDYYVIEDHMMSLTAYEAMQGLHKCHVRGYKIDTYYTDAFGVNLTSAPNAWLRKF